MKQSLRTLLFIYSTIFSLHLSAQWESLGAGFSDTPQDVFCISAVDENNIWAVAGKTNFTASYAFTRSTDGGITWQEGSLPDSIGNYYPVNIFALDANTAWIIMINRPEQWRIKIFKTIDGGASWAEQHGAFNTEGHGFATLHFFNENEGIGFGSPGTGNSTIDSLQIFKTNDGGNNWNRIPPSTLPTPLPNEGVWVYSGNNSYEAKGDTLWFVTRARRVFRSTDKGISWEAYDAGISGTGNFRGLSSIAFENAQNGIVTTFSPNRAARTTDGGATWTEIDIPNTPRLGAIEYIEGTASTYLTNDGFQESSNMLFTTDGGNTWNTLMSPASMDCMQFLSPTVGFGGGAINPTSDLGVYKWIGNFADSLSTSVLDASIVSGYLKLSPNPATQTLTVEVDSNTFNATTALNIEIYSSNGQLMHQNTIAFQQTINVPIQDLSNGLYYIHIQSETGKRLTQRFIKT